MENLIVKIQKGTITNWKNQLIGGFQFDNKQPNNFYLRFVECEYDNTDNPVYKDNRYDINSLPIKAKGLVVYYIYNSQKKSKEDICNEYYFSNILNQKNVQEEIKYSIKNLYPFISDDDKQILKAAISCYEQITKRLKFRINNRYFNEIDKAINDNDKQTLLGIGYQINLIINSFDFKKAINYYISNSSINEEIEYLKRIKDAYQRCFTNYNDLPEYRKFSDFIVSIEDIKDGLHKQNNKREFSDEELEAFKNYFIPKFKGIHNEINYFNEHLIPALKIERTGKEYAIIAYIIHKSKAMNVNKIKSTYTKWYEEFCRFMDITPKTFKPSQLRKDSNYNKIDKEFAYLNIEY